MVLSIYGSRTFTRLCFFRLDLHYVHIWDRRESIFTKRVNILTAWTGFHTSRITAAVISLIDRARILGHHADLIPHATYVLACPPVLCGPESNTLASFFFFFPPFSGESSSNGAWSRDWIWFIKSSQSRRVVNEIYISRSYWCSSIKWVVFDASISRANDPRKRCSLHWKLLPSLNINIIVVLCWGYMLAQYVQLF